MHMFTYHLYEMATKSPITPAFWEDVNRICDDILRTKGDFNTYWELEKNYHFMKGVREFIGDSIRVPLHNRNTIRKVVKPHHRIVLFIEDWYVLNRDGYNPDTLNFKDWFYTHSLTVYRGVPAGRGVLNMNIAADTHKSTTLDVEQAIRFTQSGWAGRAWRDMERRNGWVLVGSIKPCDIHIYSDEGNEKECVIRGDFQFEQALPVKKGAIEPSKVEAVDDVLADVDGF